MIHSFPFRDLSPAALRYEFRINLACVVPALTSFNVGILVLAWRPGIIIGRCFEIVNGNNRLTCAALLKYFYSRSDASVATGEHGPIDDVYLFHSRTILEKSAKRANIEKTFRVINPFLSTPPTAAHNLVGQINVQLNWLL